MRFERRLSLREHGVENHASGPNVDLFIKVTSVQDLGRRVKRCRLEVNLLLVSWSSEMSRVAPTYDLYDFVQIVTLEHENILWLDLAVNYASFVRTLDRFEHLNNQSANVPLWQLLVVRHELVEVAAIDQLGDGVHLFVVRVSLDNPDDSRMVKLSQNVDFVYFGFPFYL